MPVLLLSNPFSTDHVLLSYLQRTLPSALQPEAFSALRALGDLLSTPADSTSHNKAESVFAVEHVAAQHGILATAYEAAYPNYGPLVQSALAYLFTPSAPAYSHVLALTDGAIHLLHTSPNEALRHHLIPHLTSREPDTFWNTGAWLLTPTSLPECLPLARQDTDGTWRLWGERIRAAAPQAHLALTLARPEGNPIGERGLALFLVETQHDASPALGITANQSVASFGLPDLGFADLTLDGVRAHLVNGLTNGLRNLEPFCLTLYRWGSLQATASMRRAILLTKHHAHTLPSPKRALLTRPYYVDALAQAEAQTEAAFHLAFRLTELQLSPSVPETEQHTLFRILAPIAKLTTSRQAVRCVSDLMEPLSGESYLESSGLPDLVRATHALPLWPSSTYALAQHVLRLLHRSDHLHALKAEIRRCAQAIRTPLLLDLMQTARTLFARAEAWLLEATNAGENALEAGALRLSTTIGHALQLALLTHHAQWALDHLQDTLSVGAAHRFAQMTLDSLLPASVLDTDALV